MLILNFMRNVLFTFSLILYHLIILFSASDSDNSSCFNFFRLQFSLGSRWGAVPWMGTDPALAHCRRHGKQGYNQYSILLGRWKGILRLSSARFIPPGADIHGSGDVSLVIFNLSFLSKAPVLLLLLSSIPLSLSLSLSLSLYLLSIIL